MVFQAHALYPQAVSCYGQAAELDSSDHRWPYLSALALVGSDLAASVAQFERAVTLSPPGEAVYIAASDALSESGAPERAAELCRRALSAAPESPHANLCLGRLAIAAGDVELAETHLLEAIAAAPRFGEAHRWLATLYRRQQDTRRASEHEKLARAYPAVQRPSDPVVAAMRAEAVNSRSYTDRGRSLAAQGRYEEAEKQFREVLRIRPPNVRDLTNLGGALTGQQKTDEAITFFRQALELDPDDAVAHNNLGMALARQDRLEAAERELRSAVRADADYAEAHHNLGLLLVRDGREQQAIKSFERAMTIDPALTAAHNNLAATLGRAGRIAEAIDVWYAAIPFAGDDPSLRYNLSLALIQAGRHQEAVDQLRQGLDLAPNSSRFASLLAWELATAPAPEVRSGGEALTLARRVFEAFPQDPSAADVLAAALAESGDFEAATTTAEAGLDLARKTQRPQLAGELSKRLELYRQGRPFRQPRPAAD
jgi:superkiller protein 3